MAKQNIDKKDIAKSLYLNGNFTQEEIDAVKSASVVDSQYGLSVCFILWSGGQSYIPLDQNSTKSVGDTIDLSKAQLITLGREGDNDIMRVSC